PIRKSETEVVGSSRRALPLTAGGEALLSRVKELHHVRSTFYPRRGRQQVRPRPCTRPVNDVTHRAEVQPKTSPACGFAPSPKVVLVGTRGAGASTVSGSKRGSASWSLRKWAKFPPGVTEAISAGRRHSL